LLLGKNASPQQNPGKVKLLETIPLLQTSNGFLIFKRRSPKTKKTVALFTILNTTHRTIISLVLCSCLAFATLPASAGDGDSSRASSSTMQQAIDYLHAVNRIDSSAFWPNVPPGYFLDNLNQYLSNPLYAFESKNTNFCGYTAISFFVLQEDPLGFIKFMMTLYKEGKAQIGRAVIEPGRRVREMAGNLKYKGTLDINPATQMWFLSLADHFKGYLNTFNKRFHAGDENTLWAATNFSKFNRMLRRLFDLKVKARGADLVRPPIPDLYSYIHEKWQQGTVFLYLNNRLLYKKKHVATRLGIPTHYVLLQSISQQDGKINIMYVDGGRKTLQQIEPDLLKKIVFGITYCTKK
jgi:hypothetical protein